MRLRLVLAALTAMTAVATAQAQQHTVRLGIVKALASTPTLIAIEKGYFKEYGIKVETAELDTTALVPLAQNQLQLVEAGLTAGYFNALEKDFPVHHRDRSRGHAGPAQAPDPTRPEGQDQDDRRT